MKAKKHPLIGKFFHSVKADRETIMWQGEILSEVSPGMFLVQLYEWMGGYISDQIIVPVGDMAYWKFYDCAEQWNESFRNYSRRLEAKSSEEVQQ